MLNYKYVCLLFIVSIIYSVNLFAQEGLIKTYYAGDTLKSEINFSNNVRQGTAKFYYPNGKLQRELNYTDGKVEGVVKDYYDNGNVKEIYTIEDGKRSGAASLFDNDGRYLKDINYDNGKLVKEVLPEIDTSSVTAAVAKDSSNKSQKELSENINKLKNETGIITAPPAVNESAKNSHPEYLDSADVMPAPAGGIKTIINKLIYPVRAKEKGIQGIVKIRAYVDEYGEVTQDEVIQGIGYGCDESAKISVYYTKFTPGLIKGKPVKVQVIIPVEFKLTTK